MGYQLQRWLSGVNTLIKASDELSAQAEDAVNPRECNGVRMAGMNEATATQYKDTYRSHFKLGSLSLGRRLQKAS